MTGYPNTNFRNTVIFTLGMNCNINYKMIFNLKKEMALVIHTIQHLMEDTILLMAMVTLLC